MPQVTSAAYGGVLILHYQPPPAPPHHHERPDVSLVLVCYTVRRCKRARATGHGHDRHIGRGEANIHFFYNVGDAFKKGGMHFMQIFERGGAPASPPAERIDVIPVFGRKFRCTVESVRIKSIVERLHRLAHLFFLT